MAQPLPRHATALACCGLLPYAAAPLCCLLWPEHRQLAAQWLAAYSFGIACFLLGAWWGMALIRRCPAALYFSNGLFILAFFGRALLPTAGWLALAALLMIAIWWVEGSYRLFRPQPPYYRRLRGALSWIAAGGLLATALLTAP